MLNFSSQIKAYLDKRILTIFLFGIASGFPWVMIGSAMSAWLKDEGLSRSAIGLFGLIFMTYTFNFLWSPLLDRIRSPLFGCSLGLRRGWIITMQLLIAFACCLMAQLNVSDQLYYMALIGFCIAIFSSTQDIAIDAYRIDIINENEKDKLSAGSAMATAGWWTGYGGMGAIPFFISDIPGLSWSEAYLTLGALMACFMVAVLMAKEPDRQQHTGQQDAEDFYQTKLGAQTANNLHKLGIWLLVTVVEPFREFFARNGVKFALSVLAFIFLFKMGEAFLGRMSIVFYKEIGFTNTEIGTYSKLLNWVITIVFAVLGGMVNIKYGIFKGLMISGFTMAISNLMFALIAVVGPDNTLFVSAIFIDGFTSAWSSVAMVAFISLLCNHAFSATQYALMASLGALGRNTLGSTSGILVDFMDGNWALFFILTAIMVIPSLMFLWNIRHKISELEGRETSNQKKN